MGDRLLNTGMLEQWAIDAANRRHPGITVINVPSETWHLKHQELGRPFTGGLIVANKTRDDPHAEAWLRAAEFDTNQMVNHVLGQTNNPHPEHMYICSRVDQRLPHRPQDTDNVAVHVMFN
jgi:hypothetical protein